MRSVENVHEPAVLYSGRWLVLLSFVVFSGANAFQWLQAGVVNDKASAFYDVSPATINWLMLIYSFVYGALVMPSDIVLHKIGLMPAVFLGAFLNCAGGWLKVFCAVREHFWLAMISQVINACAQLFVLGIPPIVAAVWFGPKEVSTATALGVFGNQVGVAVGFLVPPQFVTFEVIPGQPLNSSQLQVAGDQFRNLYYFGAGYSTLALIGILAVFRGAPPTPPSAAQKAAQESGLRDSFFKTMKTLFKQRGFVILFVTYGINTGIFYAYSTLLNEIVLYFHAYQGDAKSIGYIGLVFTVVGILASIVVGPILDRTHAFKKITLVFYLSAFVSFAVCILCLQSGWLWSVYLANALIGFFLTGYLPVGFDFCVEITYPVSENTTANLLNCSAQWFGIALTFIGQAFFDSQSKGLGSNWCMGAFSISLLAGGIASFFIPETLKRQRAQNDTKYRRRATLIENENNEDDDKNSIEGNNGFDNIANTIQPAYDTVA